MKNLAFLISLSLLFFSNSLQAQKENKRPSAEALALKQAQDYERDLRLDEEQTEDVYEIILPGFINKSNQIKSKREGKDVDRKAIKASSKEELKAIKELLNADQGKRFRLLQQMDKHQKMLELSDLQKRAMFNALADTQDSLALIPGAQKMMKGNRGGGQSGNRKVRQGQRQLNDGEIKVRDSGRAAPATRDSKSRQAGKTNQTGKANRAAKNVSNEDRISVRRVQKKEVELLKDILNKKQYSKYLLVEDINKMRRALSLDKDQTKKITTLEFDHLDAASKLRDKYPKSDPNARQKIKTDTEKLVAEKDKKILALLNTTQKEAYKALVAEKAQKKAKKEAKRASK